MNPLIEISDHLENLLLLFYPQAEDHKDLFDAYMRLKYAVKARAYAQIIEEEEE